MARKNPFDGWRIEVDPERVDEAVQAIRARLDPLRERVEQGVTDARHTTVRILRNGKQIGPDLPLTVLLAGEGVALAALGPLWTLLANLGARAVLEVQLVHAGDEWVAKGREAWSHGESEEAERCYREALKTRPDDPSAWYHLGVLLRVTGRLDEARAALHRAAGGPEGHEDVLKAADLLARLDGQRTL